MATASATLQAPPPLKHETLSAIKAIIETVDRHAREVSLRWGYNRLPHLVPIEWTERFLTQKHKWELACWECSGSLSPDDLARVRTHGEAMIRAFAKLEAIATEQGDWSGPGPHWEFELKDGTPVVLVRDRAELSQVDLKGRAAQVWSLDEIADILAKFPDMTRTKECFPGAELISLRTDPLIIGDLNDSLADLPW
jgi:hypothetical protein